MGGFDVSAFWHEEGRAHTEALTQTLRDLEAPFTDLLTRAITCTKSGGKLIFFGNGGSAADAQHITTELTIRYISDRKPIAALSLTTDTSALTAAGNDYGFDYIFSRQLEAIARPGDLAVGLSTSGRSPNVLKALQSARALGLTTIGFTGRDGGDMPGLCDVTLIVPSQATARIQEMHILIGHMLCGAMERALGLVTPAKT